MATKIDNTVRIGDVVNINQANCLVIDKFKNVFNEDRIGVIYGVDCQDNTLIVKSFPINDKDKGYFEDIDVYKTDTHIQIVEDIINQINEAKRI